MTILEFKTKLAHILKQTDIENPTREASLILREALGFSKTEFILKERDEIDLTSLEANMALSYTMKRATGVPFSYLFKKREFYKRDFHVDEGVLIPRPDTEIIVEEALEFLKDKNKPLVLDLCTGSGCIGITLKAENEDIDITLSDISDNAIEISSKNAKSILDKEINIVKSDLFENLNQKYDLIVTNPPYLTKEWYDNVSDEVKKEPKLALIDEALDGLDIIRNIIKEAPNHLNEGGCIMIEADPRQMQSINNLLKEENFNKIQITKDLAGLDRVIIGVK